MAAATEHVWMALDPEELRIFVQLHPWGEGDFPPGPRGSGWPRREYDVPKQTYTKLMKAGSGGVDNDRQDEWHRRWWNEADPDGPPWPEV